MKKIEISDELYARLQKYAKPFEDKPEDIIKMLLDAYENKKKKKIPEIGIKGYDPLNPPDLRHTKIISCTFNKIPTSKYWNCLVDEAHIIAMKKLNSLDELLRISSSNIRKGEFAEHGFFFVREINASIQNVDANAAWRNVLNLATKFKVPVEVTFQWRDNDKAAHPGEKGRVVWEV